MTLTQDLINAQLKHTRELIDVALAHSIGDDMHDYLTSALGLSELMMRIKIDDDEAAWQHMLDDDLADYACGGICEELYALKPAALAYLED
jgi:hypothetical protein